MMSSDRGDHVVVVAQLVEPLIVTQEVTGSYPVDHPNIAQGTCIMPTTQVLTDNELAAFQQHYPNVVYDTASAHVEPNWVSRMCEVDGMRVVVRCVEQGDSLFIKRIERWLAPSVTYYNLDDN